VGAFLAFWLFLGAGAPVLAGAATGAGGALVAYLGASTFTGAGSSFFTGSGAASFCGAAAAAPALPSVSISRNCAPTSTVSPSS